MKPDLFFSIVVINFNYARFLPQSIGRALAQDYGKFEVIVVDDASTDESRHVIEGYGDRIKRILKSENRGHGDGFNQGFSASRGDVVLFLDADDFLYPHALSTIAAQYDPAAAQYHWRMNLVDIDGEPIDMFPAPETAFAEGDVTQALLQSARYATTVTSGLAFSRHALKQILPMDPEMFRQGGDGYLVTVAPLYGTVKLVSGILSAYRLHGTNHSQFDAALAKRARWRMEHDQARIVALKRHALITGRNLQSDPALEDIVHLTERIASLRLDPQQHPYAQDRPRDIAKRGLRLMLKENIGLPRKIIFSTWWLAAGAAPDRVAQSLIAWRLYAPSRPKWIDATARRIRAVLKGASASRKSG